jgi:uncharacterized SAM-binding protein YcdF (DUF218 family)
MEFILLKTINFFIFPLNILLLVAFVIIFFFFFNKKKIIKFFSLSFIFLFIFFGIYSLPYFLLNKLEDYIKATKISYSQLTGVIVLGGGVGQGLVPKERNEASLHEAAERLTKAIEIYKKNSKVIILFSGFSGSLKPEGWSESDTARKFFIDQGVREENLIFENQSRNTFENVKYSKKILEDKKGNWGLITSASHMARSFMVFKKNGIIVEPISVDYKTGTSKIFWLTFDFYKAVRLWNILLHEITGIIYYKLTDKI